MDILVSGSMAYDRIMDFPGRFSDHIMPDKIHMINVSFTVNGLKENLGGTAGNIAYVLSLLGENARILATMGHDYHQYFQYPLHTLYLCYLNLLFHDISDMYYYLLPMCVNILNK